MRSCVYKCNRPSWEAMGMLVAYRAWCCRLVPVSFETVRFRLEGEEEEKEEEGMEGVPSQLLQL